MYFFDGILHKVRENGYPWLKDDKTKYKELQLIINIINRFLPFIARIQTQDKTYAGLVKKLKLNDGQVKFTITDCNQNGESHKRAKTYRKKVVIEELIEIETFYNQSGKSLSVDNLWRQFSKEKTNEAPIP